MGGNIGKGQGHTGSRAKTPVRRLVLRVHNVRYRRERYRRAYLPRRAPLVRVVPICRTLYQAAI